MAVISGQSKSVNNKLEMFGLSEYFPSITTKYAINRDQGLIYDFLPVGNHGDEGTRSSNIRRFLSRMADHYRVPVLDLQQRTTYYGDRINDPHVVENIPGVKMVWRNSLTIAEQISKIRPPFVDAPTKAIEDFERSLNQLMYDEKRVIQVNDFRDERLPAFAGINSPPLPPIPGWAPYMLP